MDCRHCARRYLEGMIPATTSEELESVARSLADHGAKGFLLSGGLDEYGRVPVANLLPAIRKVKTTMNLQINAHIGLSPTAEIDELVRAGIDAFSVDVYGSDSTIREVLGLNASADDYFGVLRDLQERGAFVAPHICIGIHEGRLDGEILALKRLARSEPEALVLISLIPTKGTAYQDIAPPSREDVLMVIKAARRMLPNTRLLLGCMRSKLDRSVEYDAVVAGVDGIVLPSSETVKRLKADGFAVRDRAECCAFP